MESAFNNLSGRLRLIWEHAGFQKYFRNTGWMLFGRIFILAVSFFVGAYMARYLGPEKYGVLNYILSFVGLFAFIASLGIDNIVGREIIKYPYKRGEIIGTSFWLKIIGGASSVIFVSLFSFFLNYGNFGLQGLIILYALSLIFQAFSIIDAYFQSQVLARKTVLAQITTSLLISLLKILLIFNKADLNWFVLLFLIESIFLAASYVFVYKKSKGSFADWVFSAEIAKKMLKDSWPLIFASAFYFMYMRIDQVMIKKILGDHEVGIYSVAVKMAETWLFVPSFICASLFPAIVSAKKINEKFYNERLSRLYFLIFIISVFISFSLLFLSAPIVKILFGIEYVDALPVLRVYLWASVACAIGIVVFQHLVVENFTKIFSFITMLGALCNIFLNLLFIPLYGIVGSAFATLISYFFVIFSLTFFKKTRSHFFLILKAITFNFFNK